MKARSVASGVFHEVILAIQDAGRLTCLGHP
jgi:hypothetical protein